jgi:hypothetical protein
MQHKKFILPIIILSMMLLGVFSVMAIDWSFGYEGGASLTVVSATSWRSQGFNLTTNQTLDKINLTLRKQIDSVGTCWVWISDNPTVHQDSILSIATFNGSAVTDSADYENVTIDMPNIDLIATQEYYIAINCSGSELWWKTDGAGTFESGFLRYSENAGGGWVSVLTQDTNFRLGLLEAGDFTINFISPTDENGDSYQRQNILVNVSAEGSSNITIYFYNSTQNLIDSFTSTSPYFKNYSTGSDGTYYFNATACNGGTCKSTETRTVYLDTFNPVIDILYPTDLIYGGNNGMYNYFVNTVNFTVLNTGTIQTCLVSINGGANITVPNCTEGNVMSYTGFNSTEGLNTITVWANDTIGLSGSHTHNFTVDTIPPTVNIISPINTIYTSTTQTLNISSNGNIIIYNFNGINNSYTISIPVTFNEGSNTLNVYALDNAGNFNSTSVSFIVNTPLPPPAYESNVIYQLLNGSGSGLGIFIQLLAQALPILLIGLAFVGIIIIIGMAFKKYIVEGGSP